MTAALACLACLGAIPAGALAESRTGDEALLRIEPRVDRRSYQALVDSLVMDEDQRLVTSLLFSDYASGLDALATKLDEGLEAAGRQRVEDALSGRIFIERSELRRLRIAIEREQEMIWPEADRLAERLILNTRSLIGDEAEGSFAAGMRDLRRAMYLHPRLAASGDEGYAGDGVDVIRLVDEARAAGGELESLDPAALAELLDDYEQRLDSALAATAAAGRQGRTDLAVARIERDKEARRKLEAEALERWARMHRVNQAAVAAVGNVAAQGLDASAQQRWLDRFDRACFPRLFRPTMADRQYEWIMRRATDDGIPQKAEQIHDGYAEEYRSLCADEIAMMLRGRLSLDILVHSRMDPSSLGGSATRKLYQDLLKNSGRRARLTADASAALEALLTERQRKQMQADIAAAAYGRRK